MTWGIDCRFLLITMALIHSYFVDIFVHGKLLHSSASRTHVTIYDVKKCQQNTRESMPKRYSCLTRLSNKIQRYLFRFDQTQFRLGKQIK